MEKMDRHGPGLAGRYCCMAGGAPARRSHLQSWPSLGRRPLCACVHAHRRPTISTATNSYLMNARHCGQGEFEACGRIGKKSKPQTRNKLTEPRVATERIESGVEFEKCRKRLPFV